MEYIHIRSLEKYHPGYKDRQLKWARIFINMAEGDPDTEMMGEIDYARLVKCILLELRAQKPLPNLEAYWTKKGFNLKQRPMSLTLQVLHKFIEVVTDDEVQSLQNRNVDKIRLYKEDKNKMLCNTAVTQFEDFWKLYPKKRAKAEARKAWNKIKPDESLLKTILKAVEDQKQSQDWQKEGGKFIPLPATWLNGARWEDELTPIEVPTSLAQQFVKECKL